MAGGKGKKWRKRGRKPPKKKGVKPPKVQERPRCSLPKCRNRAEKVLVIIQSVMNSGGGAPAWWVACEEHINPLSHAAARQGFDVQVASFAAVKHYSKVAAVTSLQDALGLDEEPALPQEV